MQSLAACLATRLQPGDVYLLQGSVGAGKTAFRHALTGVRLLPGSAAAVALLACAERASVCSRAFIRAVMEDPDFPVPSPTFTLQTIYDEHEGAHPG